MENYQIIRTIGVGSSGCVRLARPLNPSANARTVCIKEVPLESLDRQERRTAVREAKILRSLPEHPHVVRYLDAFVENGCLWIVLEHAENGDLDAYLRSRGGVLLPEAQIWKW
ncbi:Serine/threonine-protein kinase Nek8 [Thoreauomyces humboldtii]|nr:Serine/threonine-protein kinase Nek8 [Thoreauomyces humboldtii]